MFEKACGGFHAVISEGDEEAVEQDRKVRVRTERWARIGGHTDDQVP
jgi:hypothetical protein